MRAILPRRNKALDSTDTDYQCLDVEDKNVCNKMESIQQPGEGDRRREVDDYLTELYMGMEKDILTAIKSSDFLVALNSK